MKRIDEDIKNNNFSNVYLLCGTQAYLRNVYRDKLVKALVNDGDSMNYSHYEGNDVPIGEVIDLAETMPFLAEKRVIVIENTGYFKSSCDELAEYIPNIPESTVIIFSEEETNGTYKLYKSVKDKGHIAKFDNLDEKDLRSWIVGRLKREHRPITEKALDKFISICGKDMMFIASELDKLVAYTYGRDGIYPADVDAICTVLIEDKVFLMMDAMFRHSKAEALKLYGDLLELHTDPYKILSLIEAQLRLLLHLNGMSLEGLSTKDMAEGLSMNEYRVKKSLPQARKSSRIWIMKGLELCADTDAASKSGKVNVQVGLEMIICSLSEAKA